MKKILLLVQQYRVQQKQISESNEPTTVRLQKHITNSRKIIHEFRLNIRNAQFKDRSEEIYFFKKIKPAIYADYMLHLNQLNYYSCKPNSTKTVQKQFIKSLLKKLERQKRKNIAFYRYYNQQKEALDHLYFLRENKQLDLFAADLITSLDVEFYTSHDMLAAEVIAYKLLTNFYKNEITQLNYVQRIEEMTHKYESIEHLNWTASKTDLIELIYALKISGIINSGNTSIKKLTLIFSKLFNIELPNVYKTFSEIKNRSNPRTKFLQNLVDNLNTKLDFEDGW